MKRNLIITAIICLTSLLPVMAQKNIYEFSAKDADGKVVSMEEYKGKVLLIVNTATECGFTPQYLELEALYEKYAEKGFVVLDFPCNQFGGQAPGTIDEIQQFCTQYNVQFPQFDKIEVNGNNALPLFKYLKKKQKFRGFDKDNQLTPLLDNMLSRQYPDYKQTSDIKWNFTKFLIDRNGKVIARFEPTANMERVEEAVEKALAK
ncbi:MAG: glutathione peroxidase [Bacteroidales bacterium]|nr:glutathione peroxidase [Bacteroidales bacterium]